MVFPALSKRLLLALGACALAALCVPAAPFAQSPDVDSVTSAPFSILCREGSGPGGCFGGFISIDGQSGPSGENPRGRSRSTSAPA